MKMLKTLISIVLAITMCMTMMMPASAARVTYYLSELKMAEATTADEAKAMLKNAGFDILDKNLNPGGSKAVYLGYKKTTNVDDAITDIRVMNMNGGFNISDYESILEEAISTYSKDVNNIRIAANEFAENYKAGKREAQLAYRQLNYYYVENDKGVKTYMGDYMLNFPKTNDGFADILLKGNSNILDNIRILLSMGVADGGDLLERIKTAVADESVYTDYEYFDSAKELAGKVQQLKKILNETLDEIAEIEADTEMTEEEKEAALIIPRYTSTLLLTFEVILSTIPCGESDYNAYFNETEKIDYSLLNPFVAAMTPGQRAMAVSGQLHSVLTYNAVEMSDEELEADLQKLEENYEVLSVYYGTDTELLDGAVAVTSDALREEASSGNSWFACFTGNKATDITISSLFGVGGIVLLGVSSHYLFDQLYIYIAQELRGDGPGDVFNDGMVFDDAANAADDVANVADDNLGLSFDTTSVSSTNATATVSTTTVVLSSIGAAVGLVMIFLSVYSILTIIDKHNPKYTKIPSNMVDTVSTSNGNRFINYKVVNALYKDGDKTAEKPGDTNGYSGNQWNAIYYTKSFEAGKCMTATGYFIDSASNFGKYTPVAAFGENKCYDLNSFNKNESAENIFIAFGNSNTKKSAATSVPTVVGSLFSYGSMAITGVVGLGLGMVIMSMTRRKKES